MEIERIKGTKNNDKPDDKDAIHCIIFVIKATTNMKDTENPTIKKIKEIQKRYDGPGMTLNSCIPFKCYENL